MWEGSPGRRGTGGTPDCPDTVLHGGKVVGGGGHSNVTLVCDDEKQLQTPIHAAHIYYGENCVTGTHSGRKQDKTNKVQTELENKQLKIVTSWCHMLRVNYLNFSDYVDCYHIAVCIGHYCFHCTDLEFEKIFPKAVVWLVLENPMNSYCVSNSFLWCILHLNSDHSNDPEQHTAKYNFYFLD